MPARPGEDTLTTESGTAGASRSDEFAEIDRLFLPLTLGAPEALALRDDAALISTRPGFELVATKDAIVVGVHALADDPLELVARKLLRVNLSDLAAKGAEPFGYLLAVAWPHGLGASERTAFAAGLGEDQREFGLRLLGGDTVSTPGPLTASATLLGWVPQGAMIKRSTARAGDVLLVSGSIGDGGLGLRAARGDHLGLTLGESQALARRYRLPRPRLELRLALRAFATAAADVSDGLLADSAHIGEASGTGIRIDLDRIPISAKARSWLGLQAREAEARAELATCGDDYEVVCTARASETQAFITEARAAGVQLTIIGEVTAAPGLDVRYLGEPTPVVRTGWTHF